MKRPELTSALYAEDIERLSRYVGANHIHLEAKIEGWADCVLESRRLAEALPDGAAGWDDFVRLAERVVAQLYDHHAGLRAHVDGSPLLVPTHADLWAEVEDGRPLITAVRPGTPAAAEGVEVGSEVLEVEGRSVEALLADAGWLATPKQRAEAEGWVLRTALAGRWGVPWRRLVVRSPSGQRRELRLESLEAAARVRGPLVERALIDGRWGRIALGNVLGDKALIGAFDDALDALMGCDGLVLDLRDTPSGGANGVAEPILGRFVEREAPYQRLRWLAGRGGSDFPGLMLSCVLPRLDRPRFDKPMVVLVSRWTGSMGEGMAVGLDALGRAVVVGTEMARLAGAVDVYALPHSGLKVQLPVRQIDCMDGTPRESFVPPVRVTLRGASGDDPILARGLEVLAGLVG